MRTIADIEDFELLHRFVETDSQEAFSQLVDRYLNLVYSVCLRETHDAVLAQDVTQTVFLTLFHKAPSIRKGTPLAGWLFKTSRFASKNAVRHELRRRAGEQELIQAMEQSAQHTSTWQPIEPLLHDAIASLGTKEREAILLRYFEDRSFEEVGLRLNTTESTARMRVSRAIEKLRQYLRKNGVAVPTALLSSLLAENAVQAAPASCAQAIGHMLSGVTAGTTVAVSGAVTATKAHSISQGVMKIMLTNKLQAAAVIGGLGVIGGAGIMHFADLLPVKAAQAPVVAISPRGVAEKDADEGVVADIDTGGTIPGDPNNAIEDMKVIYRLIGIYRQKHQNYPNCDELLKDIRASLKEYGFDTYEEAWQFFINPDSKYSDSSYDRKYPDKVVPYILLDKRLDGSPIGSPTAPGTKDVLISTSLYTHRNIRHYPGPRSTENPVGFWIVMWADGEIQKVPYDQILYAPKGREPDEPQGRKSHAFVFPGQAGLPANTKTYDQYYQGLGAKRGPRGKAGAKGKSYKEW